MAPDTCHLHHLLLSFSFRLEHEWCDLYCLSNIDESSQTPLVLTCSVDQTWPPGLTHPAINEWINQQNSSVVGHELKSLILCAFRSLLANLSHQHFKECPILLGSTLWGKYWPDVLLYRFNHPCQHQVLIPNCSALQGTQGNSWGLHLTTEIGHYIHSSVEIRWCLNSHCVSQGHVIQRSARMENTLLEEGLVLMELVLVHKLPGIYKVQKCTGYIVPSQSSGDFVDSFKNCRDLEST